MRKIKTLKVRLCPERRCVQYFIEETDQVIGGHGPVDCSCHG